MQKNQKIKNYKKKIADFQLAKNNFKSKKNANVDFDNISIYFFSTFEVISRLFIIISQFIFGVGIIINGFLFVMWIMDKVVNYSDPQFSQVIARSLFFIFSFIPILIILFFLLPISICNTVSSLRTWMIVFITYGLFIYACAIALAVWNLIWFNDHWSNFNFSKIILYLPIICFLLSFVLLLFFSICILGIIGDLVKKIEQAYVENYFVRVKIN